MELSLILKQPIEEVTLKTLEWNNKELIAEVDKQLESYRGVVYNENQIQEAKKDKAKLIAFTKALNDERIRIGKIYDAPLQRFKREVDDVINVVKTCTNEIQFQLDTFEQERLEKRRTEIQALNQEIIASKIVNADIKTYYNPKWENASTSLKSIRNEMEEIATNIGNSLIAIKNLKSEDEATILAYYFRTLDLSSALQEASRLKEEKQRFEVKENVEPKTETEIKTIETKTEAQANNIEIPTDYYTLKFEVKVTREQMLALKKCLMENNIEYRKVD